MDVLGALLNVCERLANGAVRSERRPDAAAILDVQDRVPERAVEIDVGMPPFDRGRERGEPVQVEVSRHVPKIRAVV